MERKEKKKKENWTYNNIRTRVHTISNIYSRHFSAYKTIAVEPVENYYNFNSYVYVFACLLACFVCLSASLFYNAAAGNWSLRSVYRRW